MDENTQWQKLAAEFLGTAFLVFVGVGSVPATVILNGDAPFTMASLGIIAFAFGLIVVATVYIFGYISGNHINPAPRHRNANRRADEKFESEFAQVQVFGARADREKHDDEGQREPIVHTRLHIQ